MRTVTIIETLDGNRYPDEATAKRALDEQYGKIITTLTARAVRITKYAEMLAFMEEIVPEMVKAAALKDEIEAGIIEDAIEDEY